MSNAKNAKKHQSLTFACKDSLLQSQRLEAANNDSSYDLGKNRQSA
jgi:hypothetical protein